MLSKSTIKSSINLIKYTDDCIVENVNHTTVTVGIVVVAILATLVVGISVITTTSLISSTTTQSAYAYKKERHNDGGDTIGNTITNQKCTENGKVIGGSSNSFQQECRPLICTNPSGNAICLREEGTGTGPIGRPALGACEACFDNLTAARKSNFEASLPNIFPGEEITTIEQLCTFLRNHAIQWVDITGQYSAQISSALGSAGVNNPEDITFCVINSSQ